MPHKTFESLITREKWNMFIGVQLKASSIVQSIPFPSISVQPSHLRKECKISHSLCETKQTSFIYYIQLKVQDLGVMCEVLQIIYAQCITNTISFRNGKTKTSHSYWSILNSNSYGTAETFLSRRKVYTLVNSSGYDQFYFLGGSSCTSPSTVTSVSALKSMYIWTLHGSHSLGAADMSLANSNW